MNFICLFVLVYILKYKLFHTFLLCSCQSSFRICQQANFEHPEGFWWAQMRFWYHLVASQPSAPRICSPRLCRRWWAQMDSDHRPHAYQACALTSWAMSPYVVEVIGFEPMTPCLQGRCSTSWAIPPFPKITLPFFSGSLLLLKTNKKETREFPLSTENWIRISSATLSVLPKRRWSSRTFRYGYLVTTSPQSSVLP